MAKLRLVAPDGRVFELEQARAYLGRDKSCDVHLQDPSVSRKHVAIEQREGRFYAVDQGSANGTQLDGQRVTEAALAHGQQLKLGTLVLRVELEDELATVLIDPSAALDKTALIPAAVPEPPTPKRPAPPPLPSALKPAPADRRQAAAALLGVQANASSWEVKARFDEMSRDFEARIASAQTPHLERTWRKNLDELREAVRLLAPDVLLDYTVGDLPSAQPVVLSDAAEASLIRPPASATPPEPAAATPRTSGAGIAFATLVGLASMVMVAASVFFMLSTGKNQEEIARRESDSAYLEAKETVARLAPVESLLRSGALRNGKLKLCNRAAVPVEIAWLGTVYLKPGALPVGSDPELAGKASGFELAAFNSAFCSREFAVTLAPGEERVLKLDSPEPRCAWDGSALFWSLAAQRAAAPAAAAAEAAAMPPAAVDADRGTIWMSGLVEPGGCVNVHGDW
jgi:pSer/pThr/pTyr-binding forkhead associated (FHA) protein